MSFERSRNELLLGVRVIFACFLLVGCRQKDGFKEKIDVSSLLRGLADVATFARDPGGYAGLISTYDRSGGNNDGAFWALTGGPGPDGLCVVADLRGPGCITRIWQTSLPAEEWLFYFDGEELPRIQVTNAELFGASERFPKPICGVVSEGQYCYMPMPYARSLKIAVRAPSLQPTSKSYCHVNYVGYPPGTPVVSFPKQMDCDTKMLLNSVCRSWAEKDDAIRASMGRHEDTVRAKVDPGSEMTWLDRKGPGVIREFSVKFDQLDDLTVAEKAQLLRGVVLRIYWDGQGSPSVDAPLGDFFCNAANYRSYSSLPLAYLDGAYVCRFPMPFATCARATLRNDSSKTVGLEVSYAVDESPAEDRNYFHARWNSSMSRGKAYDVLTASGQGHYVGCYLNAIGADGSWFILEGDEAIVVDDGRIPTMHGTGLEDYFNGAWYYSGLFDMPLHGLVEKAPVRTGQYRFHVLDSVKFNENIRVMFEFGHANGSKGYMSSAAYWYQRRPGPARSSIPPLARRVVPLDPLHHAGFMSHLFELERIGHFAEARDRCREYVERFPKSPAASMLELRAAAYTEILSGFESAREGYLKASENVGKGPTGQQAEALLWFHENKENAILACHANAVFKLYLDGRLVASGSDPVDLQAVRVSLEAGTHELSAEITAVRPDPWFSVFLRTHGTNVVTDSSWVCVHDRPVGWPAKGCDLGPGQVEAWRVLRILPRIGSWQFSPNAFVNMQAGPQLMRPWDTWGSSGRETAYVRKEFVVVTRRDDVEQE